MTHYDFISLVLIIGAANVFYVYMIIDIHKILGLILSSLLRQEQNKKSI